MNMIVFLGPQAPVVVTDNETEVSYGIEGDMSAPPTGGTTSKPEVKVLDIKSTPSAKAAGSRGSSATTKTRSPILLYRWSFKVLPKGMVILLGFKRYARVCHHLSMVIFCYDCRNRNFVMFCDRPIVWQKHCNYFICSAKTVRS